MSTIDTLNSQYERVKKDIGILETYDRKVSSVQNDSRLSSAKKVAKSVELISQMMNEVDCASYRLVMTSSGLGSKYIECVKAIDKYKTDLIRTSGRDVACIKADQEAISLAQTNYASLKERIMQEDGYNADSIDGINGLLSMCIGDAIKSEEKKSEELIAQAKEITGKEYSVVLNKSDPVQLEDTLPGDFLVARIPLKSVTQSILRDIGVSSSYENVCTNLRSQGNVIVCTDFQHMADESIDAFVMAYVLRVIETFPLGTVNVHIFDDNTNYLYKVCGLNFNGQAYTNGRCYLPLNAPIEISYYTLKISIGSSNAQYIGQDYNNVVDSLKEDGFTNVQTEEVKTGWANGNSVISVMINNSSSFDIGQTYDPGVKIVVKYSSNDRVEMTDHFKNWRTTNYSTVRNALTSAGFTNVTVVAKDTSDKSQNQMIAGLTFNGEAYTGGDCFLQKSAPIVIEYYNLKITLGKAAKDYTPNTEGHYSTVVNELKTLGFTNITVYRLDNIIWGITKEGSVDSISIAGNNDFTATDSFYYDAEIIIMVNTRKGKGCEDITLIAQ